MTDRRILAAALFALALLLLAPSGRVSADGGPQLASLVAQATGVSRTYDATLAAVAQVRSAEISTTFAHRPMPELAGWNWGEVIASNAGAADPFAHAVSQWQGSAPHWAILTNPAFQRIGCDRYLEGATSYLVCVVGTPGGAAPPVVSEIPDTAMERP